jgi:hypothetical protein
VVAHKDTKAQRNTKIFLWNTNGREDGKAESDSTDIFCAAFSLCAIVVVYLGIINILLQLIISVRSPVTV